MGVVGIYWVDLLGWICWVELLSRFVGWDCWVDLLQGNLQSFLYLERKSHASACDKIHPVKGYAYQCI